ncbi:MAG: hypothetical protein ACE5DN_07440, partial [Flavobacteriales bacterium]
MKRILICAIAIVQVFICVSQTTTYSESFTQNITPTSQCTNWNNWRATLDTCYTQVTLSSSLGCSETCTDVSIVRQIITTLIAGGNGSWVYGGKEWYVSNALGVFIGVFSTIGSPPTQCDSSIVVMRPCIFNSSWGGCNHDDCGAPSQTLTLSFSGGLVSSVNTANPVCNGDSSGSATVTPSGGVSPYTYQWDVNTGSQTTATATGLQSGTYYVTITDNYGCQISDTVVVSDPPLLTWTTDSTDETCAGDYSGSATVNITNGASPYTYAWDANTGNQTTSTATGLTTGTYYVTIADDNGCSKTDSVSVNSPAPLSATMSSTPVLCYGDSNGTASALASGGVSPYTYQWDANTGNQTTSTATGLTAGTYYVTITDNNGCSKTDSVSITSPAPLSATMGSTAVLCYGDSNGTASALASGGVSPYTYQWDANTGNQTTSTA